MRPNVTGVMGDFGVLPPDWDVEVKGELGGLSYDGGCLFLLRPAACSWVMAMGEAEASIWEPMVGAARVSNLVHVMMSVLIELSVMKNFATCTNIQRSTWTLHYTLIVCTIMLRRQAQNISTSWIRIMSLRLGSNTLRCVNIKCSRYHSQIATSLFLHSHIR